jgi:hypothetical protein
MKRYILLIIFSLIALNLAFAETLKSLPEPTGPYQIGISKHDLADQFRKVFEYPNGRLIPVQIYFPMERGKHVLHKKIFEERAPKVWPALEVYSQKAGLSSLIDGKHPVIFLIHGHTVAMTDYASFAEDLASNGYIVVVIQHQLNADPNEPEFRKERSISKYAHVIDCIFHDNPIGYSKAIRLPIPQ